MKIVVGLGNPGVKYRNNRHNVGHMFVDYLINELTSSRINPLSLKLQRTSGLKTYKTDCFMNQSGIFVKKLISNLKFQISNLIVVHDDLDIPLGKFKIQQATGPKLHNGLESIEKELGTKDFWRIRIGVDNRPSSAEISQNNQRLSGETYVLQDFTTEERKIINQTFSTIFSRL